MRHAARNDIGTEVETMLEIDVHEHASLRSQSFSDKAKEFHGAKMARNLRLDEGVDNDSIEDSLVAF